MKNSTVTMHPRKLARSMARAELEKKKITGYNKERIGSTGRKMPSVMARNWRDLAMPAAGMVKPKQRSRMV